MRFAICLLMILLASPAHAREAADGLPPAGDDGAALLPPEPDLPLQPPALSADEAHAARIQALEERAIAIKEKIFNVRAKLWWPHAEGMQMTQYRLLLNVDDKMGPTLRLTDVTWVLDGKPLAKPALRPGQAQAEDFTVVTTGYARRHQLRVVLHYTGESALFPYLAGYQFTLTSAVNVQMLPAETTVVTVTGLLQPGADLAWEDRPALQLTRTAVKPFAARPD